MARSSGTIDIRRQTINQVRQCCMWAWDCIEEAGKVHHPSVKMVQGPNEPYTDLVSFLQKVLQQAISQPDVWHLLLQILDYENTNCDCQWAFYTIKPARGRLADYMRTCMAIGFEGYKANLLAAASSTESKINLNVITVANWDICTKTVRNEICRNLVNKGSLSKTKSGT